MNFRNCFVKPRLGVPVVNWILILTFAINLSIVYQVEPNDPSDTTKFDRAMQPFLDPFHSLWAINMNEGNAPLWFVILFILFFCLPVIHLFIRPFVFLSYICLFIRSFFHSLFVHLFVCLFVRLFVRLFIHLFIRSMKKTNRKN